MPSQLWSPRPPSDRSVNPTANADAARTIALTALPATSKPPPKQPGRTQRFAMLTGGRTPIHFTRVRESNPPRFCFLRNPARSISGPLLRSPQRVATVLSGSVRKPPTGRAATVPMERPATAAYASRRRRFSLPQSRGTSGASRTADAGLAACAFAQEQAHRPGMADTWFATRLGARGLGQDSDA